jgi:membrane associated rhomboid family serine protease
MGWGIRGKSPVPAVLLAVGWLVAAGAMGAGSAVMWTVSIVVFGLSGLSVAVLMRRERRRRN